MKLVTHKKQVIGIADGSHRGASVEPIGPQFATDDKVVRDSLLKTSTSIELSFLVHAPEEGEPLVYRFARPLAFSLERVKARVTQVTQADLFLRTTADPTTLLADIVYEVTELCRVARDPAYSSHPDYAAAAASVRALVLVTKLDGSPVENT